MKKRIPSKYIIIAISSVVFLAIGIIFIARNTIYKRDGVRTLAVITDITSETDIDGNIDNTVYVRFTAGEETIEGKLDTYVASMRVGQKVAVYYMPDNPQDFAYGKGFVFPVIISFTASAGFFAYLIYSAIKQKQVRE